jgi:hypothetical protein
MKLHDDVFTESIVRLTTNNLAALLSILSVLKMFAERRWDSATRDCVTY